MPDNADNKSRLSDARVIAAAGPRRSQNDPGGFSGRTIADRYIVEEFIGMGGMAYVYRAKDSRIARTVAIKILKPDLAYSSPQMVEEFLDEAKAIANLNHRNIIEVSDAAQDEDGTTFLVMQYLKGKSLDEVIATEHPISLERAANLFEQICDGVHHAHASGIIHRDLKPGNVMVISDNRGDEMAKILDFGIAKAMTATAKVSREIGTIYYASPEQLNKGAGIDHRSDIYSLGVILYQLLTSAVPFDDDSIEHIIYQKLNFTPPLLRQLRADIPAPVEEVVARALAKDASGRYQDAMELARSFWRAISLETGALVVDCVDAGTRSSLAGVSVLINGKYVGRTDARGYWRQAGLLPRQYLIELESPGHQPQRESVHVEPREEVTITIKMVSKPSGDLFIGCGVAGAQVVLDGKRIGVTDENGRFYLEALDAGRHGVKLSHPQYIATESEVEIRVGEQPFIELALIPKSASWWQRPVVIIPMAAGLLMIGVAGYWATSSRDESFLSGRRPETPTPTPVMTPLVSPTPTATPREKTTPSPSPTTKVFVKPSPIASPKSSVSSTPAASPKLIPKEPVKLSESVLQSGAIKTPQPVYPPIARAARAAGTVQVQVTISEEGRVTDAQVISGHPLLRDAALQAARQWLFKPTKLSGVPVKVQGLLTFKFTLQ